MEFEGTGAQAASGGLILDQRLLGGLMGTLARFRHLADEYWLGACQGWRLP